MSSVTLIDLAQRWLESLIVEGGRYLLVAGSVALIIRLMRKKIEVRKIQASSKAAGRFREELTNSLRTVTIFALTSTMIYMLSKWKILHIKASSPSALMFLFEFVGLMVFHDTWFYWMHRSVHRKTLFRRVHATHHRSIQPTAWAAYSFSPSEAVAESLFLPAFLLMFSAHLAVLITFAVHQLVRNVLGHCGFEFLPSGFTRNRVTGFFTTTTHHDLHHREGRYNFGLYFTFWDRVMKTEHPDYHERFEDLVSKPRERRSLR